MSTHTLLARAMADEVGPRLRTLPDRVVELLSSLGSPPRLAAHLRAVHDVAHQLVDWLEQRCPAATFDREAVLFGAATHDTSVWRTWWSASPTRSGRTSASPTWRNSS
ncbi:hypothetical protein [Streptomyces adustus]|uniref:hypothetical protein n=1 Tax=Streptomyces adustus TaxID=1609272 RepID=UPI003B75D349